MTTETKCAVCGKPVQPDYRPFCSKRCADIDLGRWLGERYTIPAEEPPDDINPDPTGETGEED